MLLSFFIWGEERVVKDWVDLLRLWEEESRVGWGSHKNLERAKAFVSEFGL